jgi:hypothetical protein
MGGGGGGWNPFEGVSWNTPFGGSQLGQTLYGGTNGGVNSVFNNVSWDKPLGDNSMVGQALYGNSQAPLTSEGKDKNTGDQVIVPGTGGSSTTNDPQFGGTIVAPPASATSTPTTMPSIANRGGTFARFGNNAAENALRQSYLGALKPNYGFTFQNQANPYKAVSTPTVNSNK